jgi:hypothetical protein
MIRALVLSLLFAGVSSLGYPAGFDASSAGVPEGVAYTSLWGGGYLISSAFSGSLSWLGENGAFTNNFLSGGNSTYGGSFGILVDPASDSIYVARTNFVPDYAGAVDSYSLSTMTYQWTHSFGPGFANDLAIIHGSPSVLYITDTVGGKIWKLPLMSPYISSVAFSNASVLGPYCNSALVPYNPSWPNCSLGLVGINGLKAVPGSSNWLVGGIAQGQVSRSRLFCFDTNTSDFFSLNISSIDSFVSDGLIFLPNGDLVSTGAPNTVFVVRATGGWCGVSSTYQVIWSGAVTGTQDPTTFSNNGGNVYTTVTYNCDMNITVALGTSFAPFFPAPWALPERSVCCSSLQCHPDTDRWPRLLRGN